MHLRLDMLLQPSWKLQIVLVYLAKQITRATGENKHCTTAFTHLSKQQFQITLYGCITLQLGSKHQINRAASPQSQDTSTKSSMQKEA